MLQMPDMCYRYPVSMPAQMGHAWIKSELPYPQRLHPCQPQTGQPCRRRRRLLRQLADLPVYACLIHDLDHFRHRLRARVVAAGFATRTRIFRQNDTLISDSRSFFFKYARKRRVIRRIDIRRQAQRMLQHFADIHISCLAQSLDIMQGKIGI